MRKIFQLGLGTTWQNASYQCLTSLSYLKKMIFENFCRNHLNALYKIFELIQDRKVN